MVRAKILVATLASTLAVSMAHAGTAKGDLEALHSAKLSMTDAIHMAEQKGNGTAIDAEIDTDDGSAVYTVEVLSRDGKKLTEYKLDARTGQLREADNEPFQKVFTRLKPQELANAQTSLATAIGSAERQTGGKVIEAETEKDGKQVRYDLKLAQADGSTHEMKIDGSTGKVASME